MYNATVRIGNWVEDVALEKERIASFVKQREQEKLLVQRTRRLFDNLLRESHLSRSNDGLVKFGQCIQLGASVMPANDQLCSSFVVVNVTEGVNAVLAGTVDTEKINEISYLANDCRVVASPILVPCPRNSFAIKSADNTDRNDENLLYGQEFTLQIIGSSDEELYVRSEKPLIDGPHGPLEHNLVCLSNQKDYNTTWKALHRDKEMRLESEGTPFSPFTRVVLRHSMTGLDLAVEVNACSMSIFGNECGTSCHTYLDVTKRETAECLWMFITGDSYEAPCSGDAR